MENKNIEEIKPLIYAIEIRDFYTQGHSEHVAVYSKEFASFLGMNEKECNDIYIAGLLHDIGKIGIPDNILLKPGKLEKDKFDIIKLHSSISGKIVEKLPNFSYLAKVVRHHHENYDGSGYPDGLKGEEIPFGARVLSLADVFDALTTGRVYRRALNLEKALIIMDNMQKNNKFDPNLYPKFVEFIKNFGIYFMLLKN
jgi:HD-GYP domain-containing protein (c-di-GMP phosphodiesterase class II)